MLGIIDNGRAEREVILHRRRIRVALAKSRAPLLFARAQKHGNVGDAMAVSRHQLYDEVWAEPMTTVAMRYHVSSSFLARVCERLGVPRPPRGFWAQRAVGIKLEQPTLPKPEPGSELEWVRDGSEPRRQPMLAARRTKQAPRERPDTHALLVGAHAHFMHARERRDEQYQRPYKHNLVDVFVSKELIDDALQFASELFLALEDRNHIVTLAPAKSRLQHVPAEVCEGYKGEPSSYHGPGRWKPAGATLVTIGDVSIGLTVFEVSEEVDDTVARKLVAGVDLVHGARRYIVAAPSTRSAEREYEWLKGFSVLLATTPPCPTSGHSRFSQLQLRRAVRKCPRRRDTGRFSPPRSEPRSSSQRKKRDFRARGASIRPRAVDKPSRHGLRARFTRGRVAGNKSRYRGLTMRSGATMLISSGFLGGIHVEHPT